MFVHGTIFALTQCVCRKHRADKQLFLISAAFNALLFYWNAKSPAAHLQPTFLGVRHRKSCSINVAEACAAVVVSEQVHSG